MGGQITFAKEKLMKIKRESQGLYLALFDSPESKKASTVADLPGKIDNRYTLIISYSWGGVNLKSQANVSRSHTFPVPDTPFHVPRYNKPLMPSILSRFEFAALPDSKSLQ